MVSKPIDMKYIYKRERSLRKNTSLKEASEINLSNIKNPELYRITVENYTKDCASYKYALSLLENLYKDNKYTLLESTTQKMINDIIPSVEASELQNCIEDIKSSNIGEINKDRLIESAKMYKSVDRIRKNHKNLTKRFELKENFLKGKSSKERCKYICEMVDTYTLSPFIKFNISLEEMTYINYTEGYKMPELEMVQYITEYFLLRSDNTQEDIDNYKRAIIESKVLSESADLKVKYLTESKCITDIHQYLIDPNKNFEILESKLETYINSNFSINKINSLISLMREFADINGNEVDLKSILENINVDEANAKTVIDLIKENNISDIDDFTFNCRMIMESDINDEVYANGKHAPETFTSDQIDKFQMHNLVTDAINIGEFIDKAQKTSMKESPFKIVRTDKIQDQIDESNICNYIDNENHISLRVRSFVYENGNIEEINDILKSINNCANNILYNRNSSAYYVHHENTFDFYVRSNYSVILSESQEKNRGFANSEKEYICMMNEYTKVLDEVAESPLEEIYNKLSDRKYAATISAREAAVIYEVLSPYIDYEDNIMEEFIDLCKEEANPAYERIRESCNYVELDPLDVYENHKARLEFCAGIMGITKKTEFISEEVVQPVVSQQKSNGKVQKKDNFNMEDSASDWEWTEEDEAKLKASENNETQNNTQDGVQDNSQQNAQQNNQQSVNNTNQQTQQPALVNQGNQQQSVQNTQPQQDSNNQIIEPHMRKKRVENKDGITSNDVKLAWQGVKAKLKNGSAKEQELSKDLDMNFTNLVKNLKGFFGLDADRRQEIITGEVNMSLSKAIKRAIAFAGIGAGAASVTAGGVGKAIATKTLGPYAAIAPIIGAIVHFARSKYMTNKEKKQIIDEIDIELKVLEREISRAEAAGSTKKYRQLLTIEKNLQRRRQEIYYDLSRKGKKIQMQSTEGLRGRE